MAKWLLMREKSSLEMIRVAEPDVAEILVIFFIKITLIFFYSIDVGKNFEQFWHKAILNNHMNLEDKKNSIFLPKLQCGWKMNEEPPYLNKTSKWIPRLIVKKSII